MVAGLVRSETKYTQERSQELKNLQIPNVVVNESPKNRNTSKLLRKYKSRWLIDLHDPGDPKFEAGRGDEDVIDWIVYKRSSKLKGYLDNFVESNYKSRGKKIGPKYPVLVPYLYKTYSSRYLGVELYPTFAKQESLDFLKKFTGFLKSTDLVF